MNTYAKPQRFDCNPWSFPRSWLLGQGLSFATASGASQRRRRCLGRSVEIVAVGARRDQDSRR